MSKKEKRMSTTMTIGMANHKWWPKLYDLAQELEVLPSKPIHEALDLVMPQFIELLEERVKHKKKESEFLQNLKKGGNDKKK